MIEVFLSDLVILTPSNYRYNLHLLYYKRELLVKKKKRIPCEMQTPLPLLVFNFVSIFKVTVVAECPKILLSL
jgi:hypothetical protein